MVLTEAKLLIRIVVVVVVFFCLSRSYSTLI